MCVTSRFYFLLRKISRQIFWKVKICFTFFTFHYIIFYCRDANRSTTTTSTHTREAIKLMESADVSTEKSDLEKSDLEKLQRIIPDFKLNVWEAASPPEQPKLYFEGDSEADKMIMLFRDKQQFSVITDVAKFFGFAYFLPCCNKFYNSLLNVKYRGDLPCKEKHAAILPKYWVKWCIV